MGKLLRRFGRLKQPDSQHVPLIRAVGKEVLRASWVSGDALPPFKAAIGGLLHFIELGETVKKNRDACQALAQRVEEIRISINNVVSDTTKLSPDLRTRIMDAQAIHEFNETLHARGFKNKFKRFILHREDQEKITGFEQDFDSALQEFHLLSMITLQPGLDEVRKEILELGPRLHSLETSLNLSSSITLQTGLDVRKDIRDLGAHLHPLEISLNVKESRYQALLQILTTCLRSASLD